MLHISLRDVPRLTYEILSRSPNSYFMHLSETEYQEAHEQILEDIRTKETEIHACSELLNRMTAARKLHKLVVPYVSHRKAA